MKTEEVTNFLRYLVNTTMLFTTDKEGYVLVKKTEERFLLAENSSDGQSRQKRPVILYQDLIRDQEAHILNPLSEGLGQSAISLWFLTTLKFSFTGRLFELFTKIVQMTVDEKKKKKPTTTDAEETYFPPEILKISSHIIDNVDDTTLSELRTIFHDADGKGRDFLIIIYQRKNLRHVVQTGLSDPEDSPLKSFKSKFPKVRKKTWVVLEQLLLDVFHIRDMGELSKFDRTSEGLSCVRFSSLLNVLLSLYQEINPLLSAVFEGEMLIDLSVLAEHIIKLPAYARNAQYMITPDRSGNAQTTRTIPGAAPNIPGAAPMNPITTPQSGFKRVPGEEQYQQSVIPIYGNPPVLQSQFGQPAPGFQQPPIIPVYEMTPSPPPPFSGPYTQLMPLNGPNMTGVSLIPGMPMGIYR